MLVRLQREALQRGGDDRLTARLDRALAMPGVPRGWRQPDFAAAVAPTLTVALARDALRVRFVVTVTAFSAPQQVSVDELRIESCFPADGETRAACAPRGAVARRKQRPTEAVARDPLAEVPYIAAEARFSPTARRGARDQRSPRQPSGARKRSSPSQ